MQRKELNPALPYPKWKPWPVGHPFNWHTSLGLNQLKSAFWTKYRLSKSDQRTGKVEEEDTSWYTSVLKGIWFVVSILITSERSHSKWKEKVYIYQNHIVHHILQTTPWLFKSLKITVDLKHIFCKKMYFFLPYISPFVWWFFFQVVRILFSLFKRS